MVVPADKASNNIVFVCKTYYIDCLVKELGINSPRGNPTYTITGLSKAEIISNHTSVLNTFGINANLGELDLPLLYWIPKLHKNPYKQRYIAGSAKCSTKALSNLLTNLLTTTKEGLQKYCETTYSRNGGNQMWILKNAKDLLSNLSSPSLSEVNSINTYDFSAPYTKIHHDDLKTRLKDLIFQCFFS